MTKTTRGKRAYSTPAEREKVLQSEIERLHDEIGKLAKDAVAKNDEHEILMASAERYEERIAELRRDRDEWRSNNNKAVEAMKEAAQAAANEREFTEMQRRRADFWRGVAIANEREFTEMQRRRADFWRGVAIGIDPVKARSAQEIWDGPAKDRPLYMNLAPKASHHLRA
jgi:predicted ribosome quality control (RQC) complex YloA/Tae2 family protein